MRQNVIRFSIALMVAGILASQPATAGCRCPAAAPFQTTNFQWGFGADCTAAHNDMVAKNQAEAESLCEFGVCAFGAVTITWPCEPSSMPGHEGQMQKDGTIDFKCLACWEGPGGGGGGSQ